MRNPPIYRWGAVLLIVCLSSCGLFQAIGDRGLEAGQQAVDTGKDVYKDTGNLPLAVGAAVAAFVFGIAGYQIAKRRQTNGTNTDSHHSG